MELYTIYIDDKKVIIADTADLNFNGHNTLFAEFDTKSILHNLIDTLKTGEWLSTLYMYGSNPDAIWEAFKEDYTLIEAAGGLVINKAGHALLIFRLGKWDLPKGKVEKKERIEAAALREVIEECGVKDLAIESKIGETYHTYSLKGKGILKTSHWYLMRSEDPENELVPQIEEGISIAKWMNVSEVLTILDAAYPSVKDVLCKHFIKSL